jgi:hypothetical protein
MSQSGKIDEPRKVYSYPSNGNNHSYHHSSPIESYNQHNQQQQLQSHGINSRFEQHYGHPNPVNDDVTLLPYLHCLQTLISGNIFNFVNSI